MSRIFPAKYDGRCPECGETFVAGEMLTYDESDRVVHADCTDSVSAARPGKPAVVCPRCFMAKPASGVCDCEDQS